MTGPELDNVRATIENEGFGYAFIDYSSFTEIEDEKFHELRKAYVAAHDALAGYLGVDY